MVVDTTEVNLEVFRRYAGLSLPRHVSYPMPTWWYDVGVADVASMFEESRKEDRRADLSLYLHVPYCTSTCRFCACTRAVLPTDPESAAKRVEAYVSALEREITGLKELAGTDRILRQIHWGGGSPTCLDPDVIERVHDTIGRAFTLAPDAEISIEVDPRGAPPDKLRAYKRIGFNRVSLGVQDFDRQVQEHVRRIQPFELVRDTVSLCRELGLKSVNFDLIYGLPYQTTATIRDTLERTIQLSPDRIAYYHYAQIPEKIATQRGMDYTKLPDSETKLEMFLLGARMFGAAGYEFVGLDHFAKPDELLAKAKDEGTLQRNFQGMTTGGGLDLLAVGSSSISHLCGIGFLQNVRTAEEYLARFDRDETPIHRGKRFTEDDRIRQAVMNELYCSTVVRPEMIERRFSIDFADYFSRELEIMQELQRDGLVTVEDDGVIHVTFPLGRVLLRTIAAVFDAYLDDDAYRVGDRNCYSANA